MMAQAYMPPKKDKTQEAKSPPLTPQERARGINYAFGRPNSYPLFWLQRAAISSKAEHSPFSGELSGEMTHLSTDPQWVAEPFEIRIEGNFPSSNLNDLKIHGRFDHRNQNPTESVALSIGAYEVGPRLFSESPEVTFGILKAVGNLDLKASYAQGIVELKNHSLFKNISYQIESNQKEVKDILVGATNDIQVVTVDAKINGPWDTLSMAVTSNLGDAVEKAFRKQIQIRIEKAQRELREYVEKQIAGEKTRLEAELAKITGQVTSAVSQAQNQANQLKSQSEGNAQATQKNAEKKARQDLEKAGNKAMEDLKKRLKF
jgi:uncharacterized protein (TIGR03545 family)